MIGEHWAGEFEGVRLDFKTLGGGSPHPASLAQNPPPWGPQKWSILSHFPQKIGASRRNPHPGSGPGPPGRGVQPLDRTREGEDWHTKKKPGGGGWNFTSERLSTKTFLVSACPFQHSLLEPCLPTTQQHMNEKAGNGMDALVQSSSAQCTVQKSGVCRKCKRRGMAVCTVRAVHRNEMRRTETLRGCVFHLTILE